MADSLPVRGETQSERLSAPNPVLDFVFLDVGGPLYDDTYYREATKIALRELGGGFTDEEYEIEYESLRRLQSGSFKQHLAERFLGADMPLRAVVERVRHHWFYPPDALLPDVRDSLPRLAAAFRLGVLANQEPWVRETMRRDGIAKFFDVWAISAEMGLAKPDERFFRAAIDLVRVEPARTAMCGDRLDYDIRPARSVGMRTVWILRGEAPSNPTEDQLAEADVNIRSLAELLPALTELE